ncbi:hypothetical protein WH95_01560 [Kiloniella litopenaei]|uniref:HTH gntR-type domain-containing protein n=1 Tax=Kiloniella litopenaei TaxID=1549748 RepID=A0A0M2REB7_9PROT|nr:FadR/GntR family transcriptional regulator [Kiloniella litopenaei]KKJ78779.1 hypothetical protein WH95_01560 [Kiloniella litopenaei]
MSKNVFSQLKQSPVRREGLAEKVLHRILDLIRSGNLKPGDKLPSERNLMEIFDVSRPPIREALSALNILGVVETRHGGGAIITDLDAEKLLGPLDFFLSISNQNIEGTFDCRRLIESEAAAKAAMSQDVEARNELMIHANAQRKLKDAVAFRIADKEFHERISLLSKNEMLSRLSDGLYNLGLDIRRMATENPATVKRSVREHIAIAEAIRAGNPDQARDEMTKHLDSIERSTLEIISKQAEIA